MNIELECTVEVVLNRYSDLADKAENDENVLNELIKKVRMGTFNEYEKYEIKQLIKENIKNKKYDCKYINGLPVINENSHRLGFKNPKSNTIHLAANDSSPKDKKLSSVYTWSICNFGSASGKTEENAVYITNKDIEKEYVVRNDDFKGKICGRCRKIYQNS